MLQTATCARDRAPAAMRKAVQLVIETQEREHPCCAHSPIDVLAVQCALINISERMMTKLWLHVEDPNTMLAQEADVGS